MTGHVRAAFRARHRRSRQFAIGILLLFISAMLGQAPVHVGTAGHALQQQQTATASHGLQHHMPDDRGAAPSGGCNGHDNGLSPVGCCQTCLIAAVPVDPPAFDALTKDGFFTGPCPGSSERSPEGILRPPCLIAV